MLLLGIDLGTTLLDHSGRPQYLLDSGDKAEGIRAYREKRRPEFRGE